MSAGDAHTDSGSQDSGRRLEAVILAAGQGTRMNSDLPKVLHQVADRPMVHWVADACRGAGATRLIIVVGYKSELVRDSFAGWDDVEFVEQTERLGTGHAAMMAEPAVKNTADTDLLVMAGDMPLMTGQTLAAVTQAHQKANAAATIATGRLADPTGYGRIIRDAGGHFTGIVEQKDATDAQKQIDEVNISCYCFRADSLFDGLHKLRPNNAQGEYYITDVPAYLKSLGQTVIADNSVPADQVEGINNTEELAALDAKLRAKLAGSHSQ